MTITVHCTSCSTAFPVDPNKVPEGGVNARCSFCSAVFFVEKPDAFEDTKGEVTPGEVEASQPPRTPYAEESVDLPDPGTHMEPAGEDLSPQTDTPVAEAEEADVPSMETADPDEWVFEREPDIDPNTLDVEPMETVENSQGIGNQAFLGDQPVEADVGLEDGGGQEFETLDSEELQEGQEDGPEVPAAPAEAEEGPAGFQFGRRDPHDKAKRLARVLVSDMIMYNPERHTKALDSGTLREDFEDEIKKSWEEYVDQVGQEIAASTPYFSEALNDILARGEEVFHGSPPA